MSRPAVFLTADHRPVAPCPVPRGLGGWDMADLEQPSPLDDLDDDGNDGEHQQHVNESAHGVGGHEPQDPEDDENDGDGPQHDVFLSDGTSPSGSLEDRGASTCPKNAAGRTEAVAQATE